MKEECKKCTWYCPIEHVCLLGYHDCKEELEKEALENESN